MVRKNSSNHGSLILKKDVLLSFDKFLCLQILNNRKNRKNYHCGVDGGGFSLSIWEFKQKSTVDDTHAAVDSVVSPFDEQKLYPTRSTIDCCTVVVLMNFYYHSTFASLSKKNSSNERSMLFLNITPALQEIFIASFQLSRRFTNTSN